MKKTLAATAVAALIALSGCSTDEGAKAPDVDAAGGSESAAPTADSGRSERGNLIKSIGEGAGATNMAGDQVADFVVNSITVDPVCTGEYPTPPENGHFIALDISIETHPELADEGYPVFMLNPYDMKVVAPNGTTSNASLATVATYGCLPEGELLPSQGLGPAEKATGKLLLDSEVPSGTLVITNGIGGGWEYAF